MEFCGTKMPEKCLRDEEISSIFSFTNFTKETINHIYALDT